ncbi:brain acid soluble protein 1-like [Trichogramma pretiosum]|uniref:brain acid soluble protein 1-like n=1 Tax=Trichogramma pretiosum TaxID=7493 RepID=UPI000C71924A|nr:brain acid soluble protein 1-like [Trichogramma pretiosum]
MKGIKLILLLSVLITCARSNPVPRNSQENDTQLPKRKDVRAPVKPTTVASGNPAGSDKPEGGHEVPVVAPGNPAGSDKPAGGHEVPVVTPGNPAGSDKPEGGHEVPVVTPGNPAVAPGKPAENEKPEEGQEVPVAPGKPAENEIPEEGQEVPVAPGKPAENEKPEEGPQAGINATTVTPGTESSSSVTQVTIPTEATTTLSPEVEIQNIVTAGLADVNSKINTTLIISSIVLVAVIVSVLGIYMYSRRFAH